MYILLITEYFKTRLDQIIVLNSLYAFSYKILILQFRRKQSALRTKRKGMSIEIDQRIILWLDHYIHN